MSDIKLVDIRSIAGCGFYAENDGKTELVVPMNVIENAPFILERTGRWIGIDYDGMCNGEPVYNKWECSECKAHAHGEDVPRDYLYCNKCGARMIG